MSSRTGLRIDGGDTLSYPLANLLSGAQGTVVHRFNPRYGAAYAERAQWYVFNITNFLRCYYQSSDDKFYFEAYNGTDWTTVQVGSAVQTFAFDDILFMACRWNSGSGIDLDVGSAKTSSSVTWTAQSVPADGNLGSEDALNLVVELYRKQLSDAALRSIRLTAKR